MTGGYAYTPQTWPYLLTVGLWVAMAIFSWRRRAVPGARPFAVACLLGSIWVAGAAAESMAVDPETKIAGFKFQAVWQVPALTAITCFILEYANPGRWVTRRTLALLSIPPLLELVLALTNDLHHWQWRSFTVGASVVPLRGPVFWIVFVYCLCLMLVNLIAFVWLAVRSPRHHLPVALMLVGMVTARALNVLEITGSPAILGWDPFLGGMVIAFVGYAIALFGFRILDPLPAAGRTAIEQMGEGMVVFDSGWRALSLNPAAQGILGVAAAQARGKTWAELLPSCPDAGRCLGSEATRIEVSLGGAEAQRYTLALTPLVDHRALAMGYLLLLHDVTEQRRAQAQILQQQRALAMLSERERLARELHDSIGQVLGFASLKTAACRKLIADGRLAKADDQLAQLESIMADAHADVREYILNLRTAPTEDRPFFAALQHYVAGFRQNYGIQVELSIGAGVGDDLLAPEAQMQLFRIIQEACSNVRRHAQTNTLQMSFERGDDLVRVRIQDNGQGFDPQRAAGAEDSHFFWAALHARARRAVGRHAASRLVAGGGNGGCGGGPYRRLTVNRRCHESLYRR